MMCGCMDCQEFDGCPTCKIEWLKDEITTLRQYAAESKKVIELIAEASGYDEDSIPWECDKASEFQRSEIYRKVHKDE